MPARRSRRAATQTLSLDDVDHHLLELLQTDSGRTLRDLGEDVGLSPSAVLRRINRYKRSGLVERHVAVLDSRHTPEVVISVCLVTVERESPQVARRFADRMRATPEVQQAYGVSGDYDWVVVLATVGMSRQYEVASELFIEDPNVVRYTTLFVLDPIKTGTAIPTRLR